MGSLSWRGVSAIPAVLGVVQKLYSHFFQDFQPPHHTYLSYFAQLKNLKILKQMRLLYFNGPEHGGNTSNANIVSRN